MDKRKIFGFAGSILLFLGVFAPIISLPVVGSVNYFQNGRGDGVLIFILAVASAIFTALDKFRAVFPTGSACFAVLTFTFLNIQTTLSEMKSRIEPEFGGNPFRGVADLAVNLVQIQWGFAVLILGACFLMVAAALDDSQRRAGQNC